MRKSPELTWVGRNDLLSQVPDQAFIYRARDSHQTVLYVGVTLQEPGSRIRHHRQASWWPRAASIETAQVPKDLARSAETSEIHRWHPVGNRQCPACGKTRTSDPMYPTWRRLVRQHRDQLHPPWQDLDIFAKDVYRLLGPRPPRSQFQLVDRAGRYEPGNICWLDRQAPGEILRKQIIEYVTSHGSARMSEIRDTFSLTNILAATSLARLVRDGELVRLKPGTYARP